MEPTEKLKCVATVAGKDAMSATMEVLLKVKMRLSAEVPLAVRSDWRCSVVGASSSAWSKDGLATEGSKGDEVPDDGEACGRGDAVARMLAVRTASGREGWNIARETARTCCSRNDRV